MGRRREEEMDSTASCKRKSQIILWVVVMDRQSRKGISLYVCMLNANTFYVSNINMGIDRYSYIVWIFQSAKHWIYFITLSIQYWFINNDAIMALSEIRHVHMLEYQLVIPILKGRKYNSQITIQLLIDIALKKMINILNFSLMALFQFILLA